MDVTNKSFLALKAPFVIALIHRDVAYLPAQLYDFVGDIWS